MYKPCGCVAISCCPSTADVDGVESNGSQFSEFTFSLVNGASITNSETTFTFPCPPGYSCAGDIITIVIPPGLVDFKPTNGGPGGPGQPPITGEDGIYQFSCNGDTMVITVASGLGFSAAQLTQIINFLGSCVAEEEKNKQLPFPNPTGPLANLNEAQFYGLNCAAQGMVSSFTGTLPGWILFDPVTQGGRFTANPGNFAGLTQQAANSAALNALITFVTAEVDAGRLTCICFTNSSPLPSGTVGTPYSTTLFPAAAVPGTFVVTDGFFPDGLTLNSVTGEVFGTPTVQGVYSFTVTFTPS